MACVLQIGAGGVGGVVAHKMAMNREVFSRITQWSARSFCNKNIMIADNVSLKALIVF